ncbi:MAG: tagaturonate epimerase family protein [Planctomycetaceae bacterium]
MTQGSKCTTIGLNPSFGFGDRIGLATPGHVEAMNRAGNGIEPIFPQQSVREMARTGRSPRDVMDDALRGMSAAGWTGKTGADADHLKTADDVDATAEAGFTFFTLDPSADVDPLADEDSETVLREKCDVLRDEIDWLDSYRGRSISLPDDSQLTLTEQACLRAAVKYGRAINRAAALADHIREIQSAARRDYEIELSVDETPQPTTLAEHYIIADQCLKRGMKLVSLAPRFIGEFEKGVDYKGDVQELERSLKAHAAIAELLGPYKLSLHSGSDKLSIYAALARATKGRFHVKTAGTSYLEALRVAARHDESLFRRIVGFARQRYETDRATYHVSATLASAPAPDTVSDIAELERQYLERWADVPHGQGFSQPGRQILHCTFGSILCHAELGRAVRDVLESHADTYTEVLTEHFTRHLQALQSGM